MPLVPARCAVSGPPASRIAADQRGVATIFTGFALLAVFGFAGAAIDVGKWLNAVRSLQTAADQAAFSAASAAGASGCASQAAFHQATAVAAARGYIDGRNSVLVTTTCDAGSSAFTVKIDEEQPLWFTRLFLPQAPTASAQATAQAAAAVSDVCVLALDGTSIAEGIVGDDASAFWLNGNTEVNLRCSVAVDSSNASALSAGGTSSLTAASIYLVGDHQGSPHGSATLATSPTPGNIWKYQNPIEDPYLGRTIPSIGSCTHEAMPPVETTTTLYPGVYCGGLTLGGQGKQNTVTLAEGIYYVVGGSLTINAKATVTGAGVTFVLTGNRLGQSNYATITINGGSQGSVQLSAPTSGPMGGLLFFQDRNAPFSGSSGSNTGCGNGDSQNQISGGSNQKLTGAVYFPNQSLCYSGSSSTTGVGRCTQIIARTISFTGSSDVSLSCDGTGIAPIAVPTPKLIR
jgi:hypothetical protein